MDGMDGWMDGWMDDGWMMEVDGIGWKWMVVDGSGVVYTSGVVLSF